MPTMYQRINILKAIVDWLRDKSRKLELIFYEFSESKYMNINACVKHVLSYEINQFKT